MVAVLAAEHFNVNVHGSAVGYRVEKFFYQSGVKTASHRLWKGTVKLQIWAPAEIYSAERKCVIHWQNKISIPLDSLFVSDGVFDRSPKHNSGILNGMVPVYVQVSCDLDF